MSGSASAGVHRPKGARELPRCCRWSALRAPVTPIRTSSRAASSNASRSPGRSLRNPISCCSTNRSQSRYRSRERLARCATSSRRAEPRRSWSRTTSTNRLRSPTRSASCTTAASSSGMPRTSSITGPRRASSPISWGRACFCVAGSPARARLRRSWANWAPRYPCPATATSMSCSVRMTSCTTTRARGAPKLPPSLPRRGLPVHAHPRFGNAGAVARRRITITPSAKIGIRLAIEHVVAFPAAV